MLPPALPNQFRYLNREGQWLDFTLSGVVLGDDGALRLPAFASLPAATQTDLSTRALPTIPCGIACGANGATFFSSPNTNQVFAYGGCFPETTLIAGPGSCLDSLLSQPAGLVLPKQRRVLMIADSGHNRVVILDRDTFELREIWGQPEIFSYSSFASPWSLAEDGDGAIYILQHGTNSLQKFDAYGDTDLSFTSHTSANAALKMPVGLAAWGQGANARIAVADAATNTVSILTSDGLPLKNASGAPVIVATPLKQPFALAWCGNVLYVGDNALKRICAFAPNDFRFVGEAAGYNGPVAALGAGAGGQLLAIPASGMSPLALDASGAFATAGAIWSSAISGGGLRVPWRQITTTSTVPDGSHLNFFFATSDSSASIPVDPAATNPFSDPKWTAIPTGADYFYIPNDPAKFLFIGATFTSDGTSTPELKQMRADFDPDPLFARLPAFYREPSSPGDFIRRLLSLYASIFADLEAETKGMRAWFTPGSIAAADLPWLASWLGVDLDQNTSVAQQRNAVANAFHNDAVRGTAAGIKAALLVEAGIQATIIEPITSFGWWSLPGSNCDGSLDLATGVGLGIGSRLAVSEPFGAIVGATAKLDFSYLVQNEDGSPLFDTEAYKFYLLVHRAQASSAAKIDLINAIVEREKPAHTVWKLLVIEPRMQVGVQARIGIDAVVGDEVPTQLGSPTWRIAGPQPPALGEIRLGQNIRM